jgi:hypothetical protein
MKYRPEEIIIFLGPSCSVEEAEKHLQARYFPPAKQGDLVSVASQFKPKVIGLIDGVFGQDLSVWHKEILYAISQGIVVLGASSMGALRAAETARYGMIGVGKIFERYHSWEINDDDEVALVHAPQEENYLPLSIPLINLRFTCERAQANGLPETVCNTFFTIAQSLYYPNRTFEQIAEHALKQGLSEATLDDFKNHYVDQKKEDALLLLETIKTLPSEPPSQYPFERKGLFDLLYHYDRRLFSSSSDLSLKQVAQHTALHHPHFAQLQFQALNQGLVSLLAKILQVEVSQEEVQQERDRFCLRHQLRDNDAWCEWLARNHLSQAEAKTLFTERAKARKLQQAFTVSQIPWRETKYLLEELKWTNQYEEWVQNTLFQEDFLRQANPCYTDTDHPELFEKQLMETHKEETHWNPDCPYQQWALDSGFINTLELKMEILKSKIARDHLNQLLTPTLTEETL